MGKRGTEDQFKAIVDLLGKNCKNYETGKIKHIVFSETMDNIFYENVWSKDEFYKELNTRLGIHNNVEKPKAKPEVKKVVKRKKAIDD
jgi:CRISPR/Cas system CSM-associated protein Csm5 (group 7 of RAMP superfamily)